MLCSKSHIVPKTSSLKHHTEEYLKYHIWELYRLPKRKLGTKCYKTNIKYYPQESKSPIIDMYDSVAFYFSLSLFPSNVLLGDIMR